MSNPTSSADSAKLKRGDDSMQIRRSALLGGAFAALLVVIALSSVIVWRNATAAQRRVGELHQVYARAGSALSAIRANIYLTAIVTRDYLLDPDPSKAEQYVNQFEAIRNDTEKSFQVLESIAQDQGQRAALASLSKEVSVYWDPTETALDWTPEEKRVRGSAVLRQRLHRRQEIFELVRQAETLLSTNFDRERERITRTDQEFRRSLGWVTAFALAVGVCIAGLTLARMIALERRSHVAEVRLRDLSAQLRTAQESERKHLSRELHDQVGQMLTGLRMELAALARLNWNADPDITSRITQAKSNVEQTLKLVRNIAMLMRPSMLDDLGLRPAVAWHLKEFSRTAAAHVESAIDPLADALPENYRTCIYRIVQEALTNCARHANATHIQVLLKPAGNNLLLTIEDNGKGFDTERKTRGLGMVGMDERVRELEGRLNVKSAPGSGTRIEVYLPLPKDLEVNNDSNPDRGRSRNSPDRVETSH